jgi:hypothetical protein
MPQFFVLSQRSEDSHTTMGWCRSKTINLTKYCCVDASAALRQDNGRIEWMMEAYRAMVSVNENGLLHSTQSK